MEEMTPIIILDEKKAKKNINRMFDKSKKNNLIFRPHFKTHQSKEIGKWFKDLGIDKITVSSIDMALYFIEDGWNDITIAFPFNLHEMNKVNNIEKHININLIVESEEVIKYIQNNSKRKFNLFIKIDVGYHRTGINHSNYKEIDLLIKKIEQSSKLTFSGFLAHAGHSYTCRTNKEILKIHEQSMDIFKKLKIKYPNNNLVFSTGDTPTCSIAEKFPNIDEIRPGNFIFYDLTQANITSCKIQDIAITIKCPIVSKNKERNELLIYGGGVHFSKDRIYNKNIGSEIFGLLVEQKTQNLINFENYVSKLSQEHGTIKVKTELFDQYKIGDFVEILPVHSCMTSNLIKKYKIKESNKIISRL